ncbi:phage portal protein [Actinokineospora auranticolor]|uniref:SPP1 Gp6-like portal protein n=1 Tax=Actinokineospora auranticolor TaxID=155976 RepID=A0A2S6GE54_9PSEU|nr:phage portal protein [Actinokineospora auranticolor]PPK63514.1 SPP1 Gp6-like portal protein [Actinokineospora auranticolor]
MPSATDDLSVLHHLRQRLAATTSRTRRMDTYYDGAQRLAALGLGLPPEMRRLQVVVNWPRLVVDSLAERLDLEGFRLAGAAETDERLWSWWQSNNLDDESGLAHLEALIAGRAYITVGPGDDGADAPVITPESARSMITDVDPRTRAVRSALRLYTSGGGGELSATLYLPDRTVYYERSRTGWRAVDVIAHKLGRVPVVPIVNRARIGDRDGRSEMADVIGLTDAACRTMTNLQGAQELLAVPQRYVLGATRADFVNEAGEPIPAWEAYIGRILALGNEDAKVGSFAAADLRNFVEVINAYARLVSALAGLPPHFLGLSTDNPPSADAIRSAETRLVKRAERRARAFGSAWEEAMRLGMLIVDGSIPAHAARLESIWRDPATPTYAAKADAVAKLVAAGILPVAVAWEELGYSAEQRRKLAAASGDDPLARLLDTVGAGRPTGLEMPAAPARNDR